MYPIAKNNPKKFCEIVVCMIAKVKNLFNCDRKVLFRNPKSKKQPKTVESD